MLLTFNLALVAESFGPVVGVVTISVYSALGSDSVGALFKKMARGDWTESGAACDDVAGDNGTGDDEPAISFVDL